MEYPAQPYPGLLNPKTEAPFTDGDIQSLISHLRAELLSAAETFLDREADLGMPDWLALKDAAGDLAQTCVEDSLVLAAAHLQGEQQITTSLPASQVACLDRAAQAAGCTASTLIAALVIEGLECLAQMEPEAPAAEAA
jgi:hypothetical protein